jgi:hypothetical protein
MAIWSILQQSVHVFVDIWYVLRLFGIFFPVLLRQEKSGHPGANPTIASNNASVVKTYSAVNSMARF